MPKTMTAEVWVAVDADGNYVVGESRDDAVDNVAGSTPFRLVRLMVTVPIPEPVVVTATVGDEPSNVTVAVA